VVGTPKSELKRFGHAALRRERVKTAVRTGSGDTRRGGRGAIVFSNRRG
jgi:hypothetical protein